ERALLNFGHTFAHAIEAEQGYAGAGDGLNHGEAVAVGMVLAARLSARLGLAPDDHTTRLRRVLEQLGLPTSLPPGLRADALLARMRLDKKADARGLRFILWAGAGQAQVVRAVPEAAVTETLREGCRSRWRSRLECVHARPHAATPGRRRSAPLRPAHARARPARRLDPGPRNRGDWRAQPAAAATIPGTRAGFRRVREGARPAAPAWLPGGVQPRERGPALNVRTGKERGYRVRCRVHHRARGVRVPPVRKEPDLVQPASQRPPPARPAPPTGGSHPGVADAPGGSLPSGVPGGAPQGRQLPGHGQESGNRLRSHAATAAPLSAGRGDP